MSHDHDEFSLLIELGKLHETAVHTGDLTINVFPSKKTTDSHVRIWRKGDISTATKLCKEVMKWMGSHRNVLPKVFRKPISADQRAERSLGEQFKHLKRQVNYPPSVRSLIEKIGSRTTKGHHVAVCLAVLAWLDAHDNARPIKWKSYADKRLRDECILARRFRKMKSKKDNPPNALALIAKIEKRISRCVPSGKQTCDTPPEPKRRFVLLKDLEPKSS